MPDPLSTQSDQITWRVYYSPTLDGKFKWVADEYAESCEEVERLILGAYSEDETPLGFYKIQPEIGGFAYIVHKTKHDEWQE